MEETSRAVVDGSLEALGLEGHEALIVAHDDARHPHVHVVANRVDPETGKAAKLGNSKLRLSRWAEGYEREQGRCSAGVRVKEQRAAAGGRGGGSPGRFTGRASAREGMQPGRARRARALTDVARAAQELKGARPDNPHTPLPPRPRRPERGGGGFER